MSDPSRPRRRLLGALAAVVFAAGISAATAGPAQAQQNSPSVSPGGSVRLEVGFATTPPCPGEPLPAGVSFASPVWTYTAPSTAVVGTTVSLVLPFSDGRGGCVFDPYIVTIVSPTERAVRASFTPVPAPGPCITVSSTEVAFGDVQQGGPWTALPSPPVIRTCSSIAQDLNLTASAVYSGSGTTPVLTHASCTAVDASCVPGTNQVALGVGPIGQARVVPQSPASVQAVSFPAVTSALFVLDLVLRLPAQITSTTDTELFFDVGLTAVAA